MHKKILEKYFLSFGLITTGIASSLMVYMIEADSNSLAGIFRYNYLLPILFVALIVTIVSFLVYYLIRTKLSKIISFFVSLIPGVLIGIHLAQWLIKLYVYIHNWIDIIINTR
jgi:hypothetical protein